MTNEIFEKACEINENMEAILRLDSVLANSMDNGCGNKYLASIDVKKLKPNSCVVDECDVLNHEKVPEFIMDKFKKVIWDEYNRLQKEFEEL